MAKLFQITLPEGMSSVKLDSQGRANVQYTVKNVSQRPLDARAVLISLPPTKPPSGIVEKGWVKIDGKPERHIDANKDETFTVKIAVPPKSTAGNYTFRLDTVWVDKPDEGDEGQTVAFAVTAPPPNGHPPLWLIPVILVVVIGIGVGLWLALRGPKVPNLVDKTVDEATNALEGTDMTLNPQTVPAPSPDKAGKILTQDPPEGKKAIKGGKVEVTVGAQSPQLVPVPPVVGQSLGAAIDLIGKANLKVTPSFTGDTNKPVLSQSPAPPASVPVGSPVTLAFPVDSGPCVGRLCIYNGDIARKMILQQGTQYRQREVPSK
jgi:hypothetical protein